MAPNQAYSMFGEIKRVAIVEMHKGHGIHYIARHLSASRTAVRHLSNAGTPNVRCLPGAAVTWCGCHEQLAAQGFQSSYLALTAFVRRNLPRTRLGKNVRMCTVSTQYGNG